MKFTYFIDRALGKSIGQTLAELGVNIQFHNQHFAPDCPDIEWLPKVSEKGWIVLTKDKNIGKNQLEVKAIALANAKVFVLVSGEIKTEEMINIFLDTIEKIDKFAQGNNAPFIAKIYQDRRVKMWKNKTALKKVLKSNPPRENLNG